MANKINKVAVGETLAVLFCPSPDGKMFGVTVDLADLPRILEFGFWRIANFNSFKGGFTLYCYCTKETKIVYLHRFILSAPKGVYVDHAFHRTLDNRKSEIRLVSGSLNQLNRTKFAKNNLGLRGVGLTRSGKYKARVWIKKRAKQLGTFDTPELAAAAVRDFLTASGATYAAQAVAHA